MSISRLSPSMKLLLLLRPKGVFSPLSIPGLVGWWDSSDLSTLFTDAAKTTPAGNGDVVGAWADKSGNGNDVAQTTTASKPTLHTGAQNGLPVVRFDGTDDQLTLTAFASGTLAQPNTIFAVAKLTTQLNNYQFMLDAFDAVDRHSLYNKGTAAPDVWGMAGISDISSSKSTDTSWHIFSSVFNGASSILNVDGVQVLATNVGTAALTGFVIGGYHNPANFPWPGDESELLVYATLLNDTEISQIESYLSIKWGIALP